MFYSKIISGKPIFEPKSLRIMRHLIFQFKDLREIGIIHLDFKLMASQVKVKLLDTHLDCKSFLISDMVMFFSFFELTTSMTTIILYSISFFYQDSSPIVITSIRL